MSQLTQSMRNQIVELLPRYPHKQAVTLPALHVVQDELRCVPLEAVEEIAALLELNPAQVQDTLSFYGFFRYEQEPLGKHRLWVCRSLSCMLRGGEELLAELCRRLGVRPGETTSDGNVTIEFAECLGMCEGAPCVLLDDECFGDMTPDSTVDLIQRAAAGGTNGQV
jgi:NADH-quinone oxidoreductase subunit E